MGLLVTPLVAVATWTLTCEHGESGSLPRAIVAQQDGDLPLIQVQVQVSDSRLALAPHSEHLEERQTPLGLSLHGPLPLPCGIPTEGSKGNYAQRHQAAQRDGKFWGEC